MEEIKSALKKVFIQATLGDPKAKEIIEDIKNTDCKHIVNKAAVQSKRESESIDLVELLEKLAGRSLAEEENDRIE